MEALEQSSASFLIDVHLSTCIVSVDRSQFAIKLVKDLESSWSKDNIFVKLHQLLEICLLSDRYLAHVNWL